MISVLRIILFIFKEVVGARADWQQVGRLELVYFAVLVAQALLVGLTLLNAGRLGLNGTHLLKYLNL